jgi:negative regulator of sigma E activity
VRDEDMRCEEVEARLGDYVEGTLGPSERHAVEAHLRECAACATLAGDLARVHQLAASLDRLPPPPAAWARVAERTGLNPHEERPSKAWRHGWMALAAAACVVLAVALVIVLRQEKSDNGATRAAAPATAPTQAAVPVAEHPELKTVAEELRLAEQHYENAIGGLEKLANDRQVLDPQTAEALQKNLQVIDLAINESRAAVKAHPASEPAQQSLFEAFRTKIALLQDTIALINEMRKGNQAEAVRIAEGLKKS